MSKLHILGEQLGLKFRLSMAGDEAEIERLIEERFGNRNSYRVLDNIENRYFVAVNKEDEIVAMTGLNDSKFYNGLEIDWTCVHPAYTGHNLMALMIEYLLKDCKQDVYCSCWRFDGKPINLRYAMQYNHFMPVLIPRITADSRFNALCKEKCKQYNPVDGYCKCYEDLYCRRHKE